MTAESMTFSPYPPGVGPLCGAELEAWYEDLQDILFSDTGDLKSAQPDHCHEKEQEFLDMLETCSLAWLTDGQLWAQGEEQLCAAEPPLPAGAGGDLLPPEFFELLSEGAGETAVAEGEGALEIAGRLQGHPKEEEEEEEEEKEEEAEQQQQQYEEEKNHPHPSPASSEEDPPSPAESGSPLLPPSVSPQGGRGLAGHKRRGPQSSGAGASKKSRKERELENEQRAQELAEQNEQLKAEIERLSEEVQRTRQALIEKLVNARKP
ncbi:DNA damage-inducible transcript 3 protein [Lepisosteus oculatus]|uniref:DNA damage-inducible transcript 3 protein n=1 Tax=Lepisosteus oculatus TaxID=7918 RepID=UPI0035F50EEC